MTLDPEIIAHDLSTAHSCGDINALVRLYTQLADIKEAAGEVDAACFFLTHAFVFALEEGADEQSIIQSRLRAHGREE